MNDLSKNKEIDFLTILEYYDSEDEMLRMSAANFISDYKNHNIFDFLMSLLSVIKDQRSSQHIATIAVIFSYKTFELMDPVDQFCTKFQFIENNCNNLLSNFLTTSVELFSTLPIHSGYLFSSIVYIMWDNDENNEIIQNLCEEIMQSENYDFIYGALIGIDDLTFNITPSYDQYLPILSIAFTYINDLGTQTPKNIRKRLMSIIENLIPIIDDAFQNDELSQAILNLIENSILDDCTKSFAYLCIRKIIVHQFPIFLQIAEDILQIAYEDLKKSNETMDEDLIYSISKMMKKLTKRNFYEQDEEEEEEEENEEDAKRIDILVSCFPYFFEAYFPITLNGDCQSYPDLSDQNISKVAQIVIYNFIKTIPDSAFLVIKDQCKLFESKNGPIFQEVICNFVSIIITFCNIENIDELLSELYDQLDEQEKNQPEVFSDMIIPIILPLLSSSSNLVINAALGLIQSIISRDELCKRLDSSFAVFFIENLPTLFEDGHFIAATACSTICQLVELLRKLDELSQVDLVLVVNAMMQYCDCNDYYFSYTIAESVISILNFLDIDQFQEVFSNFLQIFSCLLEGQISDQNEEDIIYVFCKICETARNLSNSSGGEFNCSDLFNDIFENLYQMIIEKYSQTLQNKYLYNALSFLGCAATDLFSEKLENYLSFLYERTDCFLHLQDDDDLNGYFHNGKLISDFTSSIIMLLNFYDFTEYIETLSDFAIDLMSECISETFNDIFSFSELMLLLSKFAHEYPSEIKEKVVPLVEIISKVILIAEYIDDTYLQSKFLINCSIILKRMFEILDTESKIQLLEISVELIQKIIYFIKVEKTTDDYLNEIIFLFQQIANVNREIFQSFSDDEKFKVFFISLLQNKRLNAEVQHFLSVFEIDL